MKTKVLTKTIALVALLLAQVGVVKAQSAYTTEEYDFGTWITESGSYTTTINSETSSSLTNATGGTVYIETAQFYGHDLKNTSDEYRFAHSSTGLSAANGGLSSSQSPSKNRTLSIINLQVGDVVIVEGRANAGTLNVTSNNTICIGTDGTATALTATTVFTTKAQYVITSGSTLDLQLNASNYFVITKVTINKLNTPISYHTPDLDYQFKSWYTASGTYASELSTTPITSTGNKTVYAETKPYNGHDITRMAFGGGPTLSRDSSHGLKIVKGTSKVRTISVLNVEKDDYITVSLFHSGDVDITINSESDAIYAAGNSSTPYSCFISQDGTFDMTTPSNSDQYFINYITIEKPQTMTIGDSKYRTFCSPEAIDISHQTNFDAYYASSYNSSTSVLTMTKITDGIIPANTGVMLYGESGTFYYTTTDKTISDNKLCPILSDAQSVATTYGDKTTYLLVKRDGTGAVEFCPFAETKTGLGGKAYLLLDTPVDSSRGITFSFENGETTGINTVNDSRLMVNGYYDLSGRRVAQPAKGLYILNGCKVFIK